MAEPVYDPHDAAHRRDPHPRHAALRRDAPVFYSSSFDAWVVTRYDDIVRVLTDNDGFSAVGSIGIEPFTTFPPEVQAVFDRGYERFPGLIEMDPPVHTRYRSLVNQAFTPRRIAALAPRIETIAHQLVDGFVPGLGVDFIAGYAFPLPMTVISGILGVPGEDTAHVQALADGFRTLEAGTVGQLPTDEQLHVAESFVAFQHYVAEMIAERRRQPRDDLLTELVSARLAGERELTVEELVSSVIHLLFAGQETTARVLGSAVYLLLDDRRRWQALVGDPSLAPGVFEEALRMEPPVTYHLRQAKRPVELSGVRIPAGAALHLLFASGNHDETTFQDPELFDPQRAGVNRHLGFGRGVHFCVGASVARLEGRIALEVLSTRLPSLRLAPGQVVEREPHIMLRGLEALHVEWDARDGAVTGSG